MKRSAPRAGHCANAINSANHIIADGSAPISAPGARGPTLAFRIVDGRCGDNRDAASDPVGVSAERYQVDTF